MQLKGFLNSMQLNDDKNIKNIKQYFGGIMKNIIIFIILLGSLTNYASEFESVSCSDGLFCGQTYIQLNASTESFAISKSSMDCIEASSNTVSGYYKIFYDGKGIIIFDLYQKGEFKGTLLAIDEGASRESRLTFPGINTFSNFSCSINKMKKN